MSILNIPKQEGDPFEAPSDRTKRELIVLKAQRDAIRWRISELNCRLKYIEDEIKEKDNYISSLKDLAIKGT